MIHLLYQYLFGERINPQSGVKDAFSTMSGGDIRPFGSGGPITGYDSGAILIDDPHKPD